MYDSGSELREQKVKDNRHLHTHTRARTHTHTRAAAKMRKLCLHHYMLHKTTT